MDWDEVFGLLILVVLYMYGTTQLQSSGAQPQTLMGELTGPVAIEGALDAEPLVIRSGRAAHLIMNKLFYYTYGRFNYYLFV